MTHRDAVALIDTPYLRNYKTPTRWADLGCGSGTFTLALADLLAPGSFIEAIDLHPSIAAHTTKNGVTIHPRTADFTSLEFTRPAPTPASGSHPAAPLPGVADPDSGGHMPYSGGHTPHSGGHTPIPDRLWPGLQPLAYDGIIMANSLHYVRDQHSFLKRLHGAPGSTGRPSILLLIEYDIDVPVARWVPYPLSFASATRALRSAGWPHIQKLGAHPSAFGRSDLYAALALPEPANAAR
jgi:SAM-dependent methyltransferase